MTRTWRSLSAVLFLAGWASALHAQPPPQGIQLPNGWKFVLPAGDAAAGKAAVRKLQCYACHKFPGADLPAERSSGGVGPDLVPAYSTLPREYLAEVLIGSHKYLAGTLEHYRGPEKVSSKMRDYSSIMTVRELLDVVEYLKHLDHTPVPGHPGR